MARNDIMKVVGVAGHFGSGKTTGMRSGEMKKLAAWIKEHGGIEDVEDMGDHLLVTHTTNANGKKATKRITNLKQARNWLGY